MLRTFSKDRLLKVNFDKSDILVCGIPSPGKQLFGFPVRKSAKYLGVSYDRFLSVKNSLKAFLPKEKFILYRLRRTLKRADFRTRYNLWQVFVCPLLRMVLSLIGEPTCQRAKQSFKEIRDSMRKSLKQFTLAPSTADKKFFDELARASDEELQKLLLIAEKTASRRMGLEENEQKRRLRETVVEVTRIRSFHPKTEEVLKTINRVYCKIHPNEVLSVRHLEEKHPRNGGWRLMHLLTSERRSNQVKWDLDFWQQIVTVTGPCYLEKIRKVD